MELLEIWIPAALAEAFTIVVEGDRFVWWLERTQLLNVVRIIPILARSARSAMCP
jgi:hypothetical protein